MRGSGVYHGSNGAYYGDADLWERFESGEWRPCCWDADTGLEWVETADGELLTLEPVSRESLPEGLRVEHAGGGVSIGRAEPPVCR